MNASKGGNTKYGNKPIDYRCIGATTSGVQKESQQDREDYDVFISDNDDYLRQLGISSVGLSIEMKRFCCYKTASWAKCMMLLTLM